MRFKVLALIAAVASASAFAQTSMPAKAASGGSASSSAASMDNKLSSADKKFVTDASHGGLAEVEASKLVLEKGTDPKVKEFAQMMVKDHTKAGDELAALAKSKGMSPPTEPSLIQKGELKLLGASKSVDERYSKAVLKDHQDTVKLFEKEASSGQDSDLKAFASKTLPTLKHHLEMAQALPANAGKK